MTSDRSHPPTARRSGVVVPRQLKWRHHTAAAAIAFGVFLFSRTWRCRFHDPHDVFAQTPQPIIGALWHNRLAFATVLWSRYARRRSSAKGLVGLISASHDGGILSRALRYFGVEAVRGSSSRRGAQALLELTTWIERGYYVAMTPDGPRGPRYQIRDGVIALAQLTGAPIIPVSTHVRRKFVLKSWDRFQIPLPFSRCDIRFGLPLHVPRDLTDEQRRDITRELERRLMELTTD